MIYFRGKSLIITACNTEPAYFWHPIRSLEGKKAISSLAHKESIPFQSPFPSEENH